MSLSWRQKILSWRQKVARPVFRLVALLFQLREDEVPRVILMFLYSLLAVGTFILGRIVRDSLFLSLPSNIGARNLPTLMALSAVCVSAAAYIYSRSANKLRRDKMILLVNMVLSALQMIIYLSIQWMSPSYHATLFQINYVYVEIMGSLQVILFWTLASELFDPRAAKRIFAIIGGGAVMANLLAFGVRPMVRLLDGTHHLLPILSLMMLACMAIVFVLGQESEQQLDQTFQQKNQSSRTQRDIRLTTDSEKIWSNRHLTMIALVVLVTFLTTSLIDYQFKVIAAAQFKGNREALSQYFSFFYGTAGILACIVQFFLANRILQTSGIRRALLLLPVALIFFSFSLATAPLLVSVLWAATLAKGSENVLRYTINDVSMNLMYVPVDGRLRARAKAFIDGILKPSSIAVAAGIIEMLRLWYGESQRLYQNLSWVAILLLGVWVVLIIKAHQEYVATLINSMQKSGLDLAQSQFSIQDESAIAALRQVLRSEQPRQVLHALELLRHVRSKSILWERELVPLLDSSHEEIRLAALEALSKLIQHTRPRRTEEDGPWTPSNEAEALLEQKLFERIAEDSAEVRAKAIELLCILLQEEAISPLLDYLEDDSPEVRAATIVGLIRFGGLDGILHAATHLKDMLESHDPNLRGFGALIIGRLETRSFYQPLRRLMRDPAPQVRQRAIVAAGRLCNLKLIPDLLEALTRPETSQKAGYALARYGEEVLPHLAPFLGEKAKLPLQLSALRVVGWVGGDTAVQMVESLLFSPERRLRFRAVKVLQRLVVNDPNLIVDREKLQKLLDREFNEYAQWQMDREVISMYLKENDLLVGAIDEQCEESLKLVFEILGLLYPRRQIQLISHHLQQEDARMRSYALELLDNLLSLDIKRRLLPILEVDVTATGDITPPKVQMPEEIMPRLARDSNPWMCTCTLWTIGQNQMMELFSYVTEALKHTEPMVRETALIASRSLLGTAEYRTLLQSYERDPSPLVARFVQVELQSLEVT